MTEVCSLSFCGCTGMLGYFRANKPKPWSISLPLLLYLHAPSVTGVWWLTPSLLPKSPVCLQLCFLAGLSAASVETSERLPRAPVNMNPGSITGHFILLIVVLTGLGSAEYRREFETLSKVSLSCQVRLVLKTIILYKNALKFYQKLFQSSSEQLQTLIAASLHASSACVLKNPAWGGESSDCSWVFGRYWGVRMAFSRTG